VGTPPRARWACISSLSRPRLLYKPMSQIARKTTPAGTMLQLIRCACPGSTALLYLAAAPSLWRLGVHLGHLFRALMYVAKVPLWVPPLQLWHLTVTVLRVAWRRLCGNPRSHRWSFLVEVFVDAMRPQEAFARNWDTCMDPIIQAMTRLDYVGEVLARACHPRVRIEHVTQGCPRPVTWVWFDAPGGKPAAAEGQGDQELVMLYLHGGGYIAFTGRSHLEYVARVVKELQASQQLRVRACIVDIRRAPEHPWPAPLQDAVTCFDWLQAGAGYPASRIVLKGDSAGGGLCLCLLLALRDAGKPMPRCTVVISPFTDLARSMEQYPEAPQTDFIPAYAPLASTRLYVEQGQDPRHPLISPKYGELHALPPVLIQAGEGKLLARDSIEYAHRLKLYGGTVRLEMYPDMPHVFPTLAVLGLEDAYTAIARQAPFVASVLNGTLPEAPDNKLEPRLRVPRRDKRTQSFEDVRSSAGRASSMPSATSSPALCPALLTFDGLRNSNKVTWPCSPGSTASATKFRGALTPGGQVR